VSIRQHTRSIRHQIRHWRTDYYILSYPKCGRTWVRLMLAEAWRHHYELPINNPWKLQKHASRLMGRPCIRVTHDWKTAGLPMSRQRVERDKSAFFNKGVILLTRDPRDVVVSNFYQKLYRDRQFNGSLADFLVDPVFGIQSIIEYYNIWADQRHRVARFMTLRYEDLLADTAGELARLLTFIGTGPPSQDALEAVVESCNFERMRQREQQATTSESGELRPADASDVSTYKTRSGRRGGYLDQVSPEQAAWMDRIVAESLSDAFSDYKKPLTRR